MKLTEDLKIKINEYFNNVAPEELYQKLTEYGLEDINENDERFNNLLKHVITMFYYGSTVYGTITDKSDTDIVAIVDDKIDLSEFTNGIWEYHLDNIDYQFINKEEQYYV